ncbi:hypothetical protein EYF80_014364 [Liparis tanakae]|uniref:Uncharacterized protein n=1 Tax=Liparis tanakae TaxID=230148 RepID=A0A4Z2IBH7_9TELE|nr:hypothetical protein EYF80_014364 [Liparis tanakae]
MTPWEFSASGSSFSRLLDRSRVSRWMRPQGTTEGSAARLLDDRSRWVIREETSMNQSSSSQGSCRALQLTVTTTHLLSFCVGGFLEFESEEVFAESRVVHEGRQPGDHSKLIAVDGTVLGISVVVVDQQLDHVQRCETTYGLQKFSPCA